MNNPYMFMLAWQMTLAQGWLSCMQAMVQSCGQIAQHNAELFKQMPRYQRHQNGIPPWGASWSDFYGRRHTDVDVEHMR
ncbi:hypothetical protein [Telmatospirillum sp. J64-1]|uniref:hypothetical protein n=1 Tax=Telmatospirillum sp. J64-1 TaxID=2502183 RepID=UPI00115E88BC|nr:hypothetical protein [Telmatospirillum sp. J64-1]